MSRKLLDAEAAGQSQPLSPSIFFPKPSWRQVDCVARLDTDAAVGDFVCSALIFVSLHG